LLSAKRLGLAVWVAALISLHLDAGDVQLEKGKQGIKSRAGCFLVDYSFVETEALKPGYSKDNRVYDVNREKSIKEWIVAEDLSPTRIKLQHVLFMSDMTGKVREETMLKHTGEDWQYNAPFLYDYSGGLTWNVKPLKDTPNLWTRRITSLDDGLRYQCAAAWDQKTAYPDWRCEDYAPIPGRESRDMGRKDYEGLQRTSRIISYDSNWLERENNVKTIEEDSKHIPLVKELGKTWYVRLPDKECSAAQGFVKERMAFWKLLQDSWDQVLTGERPITETKPEKGKPSRYEKVMEVEEKYYSKNLSDQKIRKAAQQELLQIIQPAEQPGAKN
jgi:hypothetical protein